MARDHASIRIDIWNDDDFRDLTANAQLLYLQLLSSATLNYAGVADWRPPRIAGLSKDASRTSVQKAADELAARLFIVIDEDTEEVLLRSFLKHDGLLLKPNVTKAMVAAFAKTTSPTLRGVIVHELKRLHERNPQWNGFGLPEVQEILSRRSVNPFETLSEGFQGGSESDPSLLTPNSLLLATDSSHLATSANDVRDDVMGLCQLLSDLMVGNGDKEPRITQGWLDSARLMLDKDGRDYEASQRLLHWALNDSFWKANIQSMPKFRERFDQLRHQANRELEQKQSKPSPAQRAASLVGTFGNDQPALEADGWT